MNTPDYMRIRGYIYNLITRPGANEPRIPSENELCKLFGVSRITVRGAIKGLVKDKFLLPKRGVGTFVNPALKNSYIYTSPVVGILSGDGRPSVGHPFMPAIERCVISTCLRYTPLYLPESGAPKIFLETIRATVDAIIWLGPVEEGCDYVKLLADSNIPVLSISIETAKPGRHCDTLHSGAAERGAKLAEFLCAKGHRKLLFVHSFPPEVLKLALAEGSTHMSYRKRMASLNGGVSQKTCVVSVEEFKNALGKDRGAFKDYSVIYSVAQEAPAITTILEAQGLKIPEDFSYVVYGDAAPYFFKGLMPARLDVGNKISEAIVKWLASRVLNCERDGRFEEDVPLDVIDGETVKDLAKGEKT